MKVNKKTGSEKKSSSSFYQIEEVQQRKVQLCNLCHLIFRLHSCSFSKVQRHLLQ